MNAIDSALNEFMAECQEILDRVGQSLSIIEAGKHDQLIVGSLYRDMHTLKGTAQLFGFSFIGNLAHAMESSLEPLRKGNTKNIDVTFLSALFDSTQLIEKIFESIREGKGELPLKAEFERGISNLVNSITFGMNKEINLNSDHDAECSLSLDFLKEREFASKPEVKVLKVIGSEKNAEKEEYMDTEKVETRKDVSSDNQSDSTIRVSVHVLDKLMNLVGELVLVRNQVLQFSQKVEDLEFLNLGQNLNMVTTDLQAEVMRTRMQPIGSIVGKFQRVVRDIANTLAKKIEIHIQGSETEVDKTLLEAVKDPLTHIIRNSCDHGIESPAERKKNGKPEAGTISIKAYHEGGQVVIEISDDGKGLNLAKISQKAIERGLFTKDQLDRMSERELSGIIFMAGFSTADQVSAVSGRGVGMDVVKTNIEKIGGTIDISSVANKGMRISLRIPLTLAIVPAMIIRSGVEKFAIPQVKLVELVRVEKGSEGGQKIEFLHGRPMLRLRGHLLPLVHLKESLGDLEAKNVEAEILSADASNVVVLHSDGVSFGLVVDDILDTGDIVVKPVGQFIKTLETFAGATIMGDGSVALILDVAGLAKRSVGEKDVKSESQRMSDWLNSDQNIKAKKEESQDFLLFETNAKGKYALPLCLVHRLEEFSLSQVEYSGTQKVIRYRNSILPIITINNALDLHKLPNSDTSTVPVIVVQKNSRSYGIEVNGILDVVSIDGLIDDNIRDRKGIMGSAIHHDEVIVVVDILNIIDSEAKRLGHEITASEISRTKMNSSRVLKVLLAEDTPFFRKQILKFLEKCGFQVTVANDGLEALKLIKDSAEHVFDLVVSDIEMPNMDGLTLARSIRELERYKLTPLIAVTSKFKQRDREEGERAGFNRYLEKLDEEVLLSEINNLVG